VAKIVLDGGFFCRGKEVLMPEPIYQNKPERPERETFGLTEDQLPERFRPLSPWSYFGYSILYSIPILGWVFLILNAVSAENVNKRNFARSYFVIWAIVLVVVVLSIVFGWTAYMSGWMSGWR
jgi:hypothetical protein